MQDYELSILDQYPIHVKCTRKTRGAFFCDTDQGLLLLREAGMSPARIRAVQEVCTCLEERGYERTDRMIPNEQGEIVSVSGDGKSYLLKRWFKGKECDIRRGRELMEGTANLAHLHLLLEEPEPRTREAAEKSGAPGGAEAAFASRSRELKKVRKFMRSQSCKGEFELEFLRCFDRVYAWGICAEEELGKMGYGELLAESQAKGSLIHGDYNYHNLLAAPEGMATVNFDRCRCDILMEDLYYFLRKAMEKQGWNVHCGAHMLDTYSAVRPISEKELAYLKVRLIYPEKFWKLADAYYRSNKAWISEKSVQKLKTAVAQMEQKSRFLEQIFAFHL